MGKDIKLYVRIGENRQNDKTSWVLCTGDFRSQKVAVQYGTDAVFIGGQILRSRAETTFEQMEGVSL